MGSLSPEAEIHRLIIVQPAPDWESGFFPLLENDGSVRDYMFFNFGVRNGSGPLDLEPAK